ncbi:Uncharacterized protein XB16_0395 [Leptospira santarosai]|uniref:Uncharacterized protein n=1 Tax=Leptospira santarosai TaxID=28183 RepID=A0A2P1QPA5_9LEPT|nr:Uncharacterized protein XB16_0395 [Leptospira santarosai]
MNGSNPATRSFTNPPSPAHVSVIQVHAEIAADFISSQYVMSNAIPAIAPTTPKTIQPNGFDTSPTFIATVNAVQAPFRTKNAPALIRTAVDNMRKVPANSASF